MVIKTLERVSKNYYYIIRGEFVNAPIINELPLTLVSLHQLHMIRYITDITDLENVWEMLLRMEQS